MLRQLSTGEAFATGAVLYAYIPASEREETPRVTIDIRIGDLQTSSFVDTGGIYLICPPEVAAALNFDPVEALQSEQVLLRGEIVQGALYRVPLTLLASEGNTITIEATAFVPNPATTRSNFPCILGMYLCLERLRFAIDPLKEVFYFGEAA